MISGLLINNNLVQKTDFKPYIEGDQIVFFGEISQINDGSETYLDKKSLPVRDGFFYLKIEKNPLGNIKTLDVIYEKDLDDHRKGLDESLIHFLPLCEVGDGRIKEYYFGTGINIYRNNSQFQRIAEAKDSDFLFTKKEETKFDDLEDSETNERKIDTETFGQDFFCYKGKNSYHLFFMTIKFKGEGPTFEVTDRKFIKDFGGIPARKTFKKSVFKEVVKDYFVLDESTSEIEIVESISDVYSLESNTDEKSGNSDSTEIINLGAYDEKNNTFLINNFLKPQTSIPVYKEWTKEQNKAWRADIYGE